MPLNEAKHKVRERWPAQFDIEGVPRDNATRRQLLDQIQQKDTTMAQFRDSSLALQNPENQFTVDKNQSPEPFISDINNPPQRRYKHQEYPKAMYHHDSGRTLVVKDEKEEAAAKKKGFKEEPSPDHDYSRTQFGRVAPEKAVAPEGERELTPEQLAELEEGDVE